MSLEEYVKSRGVMELSKTESGRKVLQTYRERHWKDALQPPDPRFEQVYGERNRKTFEKLEKNKREAKEMWKEKRKVEHKQKLLKQGRGSVVIPAVSEKGGAIFTLKCPQCGEKEKVTSKGTPRDYLIECHVCGYWGGHLDYHV